MWKELNINPMGKRRGDCAIRAIAIAEGLSWYEAFDELCRYGRSMGDMPNSNEVIAAFLKDRGYSRHIIPDTCPNCYTIGDFCKDHPKGIYIVGTGSHLAAIIDGTLLDAWDSSFEVPIYYYEMEV